MDDFRPTVVGDAVNHPKHYNSGPACVCGRTIECIVVARIRDFNIGSALKYLWRHGLKDSAPEAQDLRKAIWYIRDEHTELSLRRADVSPARRYPSEDPLCPCGRPITCEATINGRSKNIAAAFTALWSHGRGDRTANPDLLLSAIGRIRAEIAAIEGRER